MNKLNFLEWLALIALVIGGLNWGLLGVFNVDLFGGLSLFSYIAHTLVSIAAVYMLYSATKKYLEGVA